MAPTKPLTFHLHFNRHGDKDHVWTVHTSKRCIPAKVVEVDVPLVSVYKGRDARQPKAFFKGRGFIKELSGGRVRIT